MDTHVNQVQGRQRPLFYGGLAILVATASTLFLIFRAGAQIELVAPATGKSNGDRAAAAVIEIFGDHQTRRHRVQNAVDRQRRSYLTEQSSTDDPFIVSLAAQLLHDASTGSLFVLNGEQVSLRLHRKYGDDRFWYIGQITDHRSDGSDPEVYGPWIWWEWYGRRVTPDGPDDDLSISEYSLLDVEHGAVLQLDLFRVPRTGLRDAPQELERVLTEEDTQLVLRMPLPVVLPRE